MGMVPVTPSATQVAKSFWARKEGKPGAIVLAALAAGGASAVFIFWGIIADFFVHATESLFTEVLLLIGLAVVTSPIWDSDIRRMLTLAYQQTIRWGYGRFVELDPIGIIRQTILEIKKEGVVFAKAVENLAGARQRILDDIEIQKKGVIENKGLVDATDRQIKILEAALTGKTPREAEPLKLKVQQLRLQRQDYGQDAGFQLDTIKQEQPLLNTADTLYGQLARLQTLAEFKVVSMTKRADRLEKRRAMVLSAGSALRSAKAILKGDPTQMQLVDQAVDFLDDEASQTLGAMQDFSRWAESALIDMDIKNDAASQTAMNMFAQMEQKLALPAGEETTVSEVAAMPDLDSPEIQKLLK
jgi:hypothetical protein